MSDPIGSFSRVPLRVQVFSDLHHEHLRAKGLRYIDPDARQTSSKRLCREATPRRSRRAWAGKDSAVFKKF